MTNKGIETLIEFAIEKEEEAMSFYKGLAKKVERKEIAAELLKFADMEKGHRDRLKKFDASKTSWGKPKEVQNLKIAEYAVTQKLKPTMTWQELLNVAMQRELASWRLYKDLARLTSDKATRDLFVWLAGEEAGHKNYFEKIYDQEILLEN